MRTSAIGAATAMLIAATTASAQQETRPAAPAPAAVTPMPPAAVTPAPPAGPQRGPRPVLEASAGSGMSVIDVASWPSVQYYPSGSGTVSTVLTGRLLMPVSRRLLLGVEAGYQRHFWYEYNSGLSVGTVHGSVTSRHLLGVARVPLGGRMAADFGAGIHWVQGAGSRAGALAGLAYHVPLGTGLDLPVGARLQAILTNPLLTTVDVTVGLGVPLGAGRVFAAAPAGGPPAGGAAAPAGAQGRDTLDLAWVSEVPLPESPYLPAIRLEFTAGAGAILMLGQAVGNLATDLRAIVPTRGRWTVGLEVGSRFVDGVVDHFDHVAGLARFSLTPRLKVDVGAGLHHANGTWLGLLGDVLYHLPISNVVDLPFGLRIDVVTTRPISVPVSLAVGVGVRL